ncbi:DUF1707 SHOCT-like domain-containing protein [Nocardioides jensenii]|uniref:DUF1707 SHOCT-like domain-containing protein n=1 Tax=Nocardioides jensenii TaxID=1843 RepID=UPI00082C12F9|nr:DUF1707 domain-containing protein [Nocardioides jensenii]
MPSVWEEFEHDPRHADNAGLRAADRDRDVVRRLLTEAYAEGRLDRDELDARTDRVLAARTLGELPELVEDIVPRVAARSSIVPREEQALREYTKDRKDALWTFLSVSLLCWVIWAATSFGGDGFDPYFPWPLFAMFGTGINLGRTLFMRNELIEQKVRHLEKKERKALEKSERPVTPELDPPEDR